jgi:hypothetical protein
MEDKRHRASPAEIGVAESQTPITATPGSTSWVIVKPEAKVESISDRSLTREPPPASSPGEHVSSLSQAKAKSKETMDNGPSHRQRFFSILI